MKIECIEIEGHREFRRVEWSPRDLTVIVGDPAVIESLAEAVFALSAAPRGWSDLGSYLDALALPQRAVPEGAEAPTTRWRLRCAAAPAADDPRRAEYELGIYPPSAGLPWEVRYEFLRRFDDCGDHDVLHREGIGIELRLTPRDPRARPKPSRESVGPRMSALGALTKLFDDPAVHPFAQPLALWSRYRGFATGPEAPARTASLFPAFDERLVEGGDNLINALQNLVDLTGPCEALHAILREAVPGHEGFGFPMRDDGHVALEYRAGGHTRGAPELPEDTLRILCATAAVLATAPPPLVWFDPGVWSLPDSVLPALGRALRALAGRTQVVLVQPPRALCAAACDVALDAPGTRPIEWELWKAVRSPEGDRLDRGEARDAEGFFSR